MLAATPRRVLWKASSSVRIHQSDQLDPSTSVLLRLVHCTTPHGVRNKVGGRELHTRYGYEFGNESTRAGRSVAHSLNPFLQRPFTAIPTPIHSLYKPFSNPPADIVPLAIAQSRILESRSLDQEQLFFTSFLI